MTVRCTVRIRKGLREGSETEVNSSSKILIVVSRIRRNKPWVFPATKAIIIVRCDMAIHRRVSKSEPSCSSTSIELQLIYQINNVRKSKYQSHKKSSFTILFAESAIRSNCDRMASVIVFRHHTGYFYDL